MNCIGFPIYDQQIAQPKATKNSRTQPQQLLGNPVVVKSEPIDENEHPEQLLGNIVVFSATTHIDMLHHLRGWAIDEHPAEELLGNSVIVTCEDTYMASSKGLVDR